MKVDWMAVMRGCMMVAWTVEPMAVLRENNLAERKEYRMAVMRVCGMERQKAARKVERKV